MSDATSPGELIFLTLDEVLQLQAALIDAFGGAEGLREGGMELLESAIAMPRQGFGGQLFHPDAASMAAAYLFHICQNHPFLDGNKRTAVHAAYVFLGMNGIDRDFPMEETERLTLAVASGRLSKDDVIQFFRDLLKDS